MLFVNVTNLSRSRDVEVIRIWFATAPITEVLNPLRPLPKRLRPDESWETWVPVSSLSAFDKPYAERLAKAMLSSGKIISSVARKNVGTAGVIPGGA